MFAMIKTKKNSKITTKDINGNQNGFLVPIYNIHDGFHEKGNEPQQVYLTVIKSGTIKGPHLHYIRTGSFTCIKGNVRIILKKDGIYSQFLSGEGHDYLTVIVPVGVPAAVQCIGMEDAYLLNMPSPAWTPTMNDEHTDDFSDFNFNTNFEIK
jgi:dTDP-4-dehydrorhamnose 3,5-epimerase-like enzyme